MMNTYNYLNCELGFMLINIVIDIFTLYCGSFGQTGKTVDISQWKPLNKLKKDRGKPLAKGFKDNIHI